MDKLLILTILGMQTTLMLMGISTLKHKLNSIEGQNRAINVHIDGQAEKIIENVEEKAQFEEKALGTLAQNIAVCGYEVKEVKDKLETSTTDIKADIKQSTHTIAVTPLKIQI
jgi:hypothetical protein